MDKDQKQTKDTFSYKWSNVKSYEGDAFKRNLRNWYTEKYFETEQLKEQFFEEKINKKFLDAGCGSGVGIISMLGELINKIYYTGVDISDAIDIAKENFNKNNYKGIFIRENLQTMNLNEKFDVIFSEGVIHHTTKPFETFKNLVSHLNKNGLICFYVYKKKAPVREFVDDFIRNKIKDLPEDEAWKKIMPLTKFGKALGDLNIEINIEEDIELLEIPKGKYNLQRLLYYYFMKMYYVEDFNLEELNHINFDWYSPINCYRFEPREIKNWLKECNLIEKRFRVEPSGITVIAEKKE